MKAILPKLYDLIFKKCSFHGFQLDKNIAIETRVTIGVGRAQLFCTMCVLQGI